MYFFYTSIIYKKPKTSLWIYYYQCVYNFFWLLNYLSSIISVELFTIQSSADCLYIVDSFFVFLFLFLVILLFFQEIHAFFDSMIQYTLDLQFVFVISMSFTQMSKFFSLIKTPFQIFWGNKVQGNFDTIVNVPDLKKKLIFFCSLFQLI